MASCARGPIPLHSCSAAVLRPAPRRRVAGAAVAGASIAGLILQLLSATVLLSAAACGASDRSKAQFLSIATGGTGGVYYPYGGGLAKVLNDHLPEVRATAEVTAASVDNLKLIRDRKADIAFALSDTVADAVHGRGAFEGSPAPAQALAVLYSNYTHLVTLARSGIASVQDLRGRTVSTGSPGSGTEVIAFRILRSAGLDPTTAIRRQGLGVSESADALKDGKIHAFFWSGGLPTAAVQDLSHSSGVTIRMVPTGELVDSLRREYGPLYFALEVPAGAYPGVASAVPVVGVANLLVAHREMSEQLAYDVTRLLFEKKEELVAIHPEARNLSLDAQNASIDFHPGAQRYFRERGLTK